MNNRFKIHSRQIKETDDLGDFSQAEVNQGYIAWADDGYPQSHTSFGTDCHNAIGALIVSMTCFADLPFVITDVILDDNE